MSIYWDNNGKYQGWSECMQDLVPFEGSVQLSAFGEFGEAVECARCATNLYYQWYNNGDFPGLGNSGKWGAQYLRSDLSHLERSWKKISQFFQRENKSWPWNLSDWGVKHWEKSIEELFEKKFNTREMDEDEEEEMYKYFEKLEMQKREEHDKAIEPKVCAVFEEFVDAIMRWCLATFDELTTGKKAQVREIARKVRAEKPYKLDTDQEFEKRWKKVVVRRSKRLRNKK